MRTEWTGHRPVLHSRSALCSENVSKCCAEKTLIRRQRSARVRFFFVQPQEQLVIIIIITNMIGDKLIYLFISVLGHMRNK